MSITDVFAPSFVEERRMAFLFLGIIAPLSYQAGFVSKNGLLGGILVGSVISLGTGLAGFLVLLTFFLLGSVFSKWKIEEKQKAGIAEKNEGRRGASNALAKGGVAVLASLCAYFYPHSALYLVFTGALATALSDTTGSELGTIFGKHPIHPLSWKSVPVGTEGAVSLEGTLLGILASGVLAIVSAGVGLITWIMIPFVMLGAFFGTTAESLLGSVKPQLNHHFLNFAHTLLGGLLTALFFWLMKGFS
ncbi:MAG: DUF92 domain-containing protein [Planctomycetota bacterium]